MHEAEETSELHDGDLRPEIRSDFRVFELSTRESRRAKGDFLHANFASASDAEPHRAHVKISSGGTASALR